VHNLVRAVAPPYPGAFSAIGGKRLEIDRTLHTGERAAPPGVPFLYASGEAVFARCADGGVLRVLEARLGGTALSAANFRFVAQRERLPLTDEQDGRQ
jgi:methionyl-tRNA formyltransferase